MTSAKDNSYYVERLLIDLRFIIDHTYDKSEEEIEEDELLTDSILFRIIQIAENSEKLTVEFKDEHPEIPWRSIKGMRNMIVHDYGIVDLSIVYQTVTKSIPEYYDLLTEAIKKQIPVSA